MRAASRSRAGVPAGASGVTFINCRFVSLENCGTDTALLDSYVNFSGVGILNIIYLGLVKRIEFLDAKEKKEK